MAKQGGLLTIEMPVEELRGEAAPRVAAPHPGLCVNCDHAADCVLPRAEGVPVVFCEEWTASAAPADAIQEATEEEALDRDESRGAGLVERPKGLCATCEAFPTCAFSKPPGGVWHCEEYT